MACVVQSARGDTERLAFDLPDSADAAARKTETIYREFLQASQYLGSGNFTCIAEDDLRALFDLYDIHFFGGRLRSFVEQQPTGRPATEVSLG